jgi:hypothetical protein
MVAFLYYTSLADAMHHSPGGTFSDELRLLNVTVADAEFPEFFKREDFGNNIKKLEISHSKINPEIFRRLPGSLRELSLNSVKDLNGNILQVDQFLENLSYLNNLKSLTLENQCINDSAISVIAQIPGLKNRSISTMQGITSLDLDKNGIDSKCGCTIF